jgi:hypothetical protein
MESRFKLLLDDLYNETKLLKGYIILSLAGISVPFICYAVFSVTTMENLGDEDGFFENLTAICFLSAAIMFLITFLKKKEIVYLLFFLVFLFGAGEEISWGQRIFNIATPDYFEENNLQDEINIHNLIIFNNNNPDYEKSGLKKIFSMNFEFKLFCVLYCFILPLVYPFSGFTRRVVHKFRIPVPPLSIGLLFVLNWLIFRMTLSFFLPGRQSLLYYSSAVEISEFGSSFLFMMLSHYFLKVARGSIKQYQVFSQYNMIPFEDIHIRNPYYSKNG